MLINVSLYLIVVVCAVWAMFGKSDWGKLAFAVTLVADALLLFAPKEAYPLAVSVFALAHCFWAKRNVRRKWRGEIFAIAVSGLIGVMNGDLILCSVVYAAALITHLTTALIGAKRGRVGRWALSGAVLFVLCDICVALYNTAAWAENFWILAWAFYAPSLICLTISTYKNHTKGEELL